LRAILASSLLLLGCAAPPAPPEAIIRARAFLESHEAQKPGDAALRALALNRPLPGARIPENLGYPHDFETAYVALAVIRAQQPEAAAFVKFLLEHQSRDGDWGYSFAAASDRWTETTMNVPIVEALLDAGERAAALRAVRWLESYQAVDGRFFNDRSRPPSTEATAAVVSVLARVGSTAVKAAKLVRIEEILGAMKDGVYPGLTGDDRQTHGPGSYPYGLYYAALAERRTTGRADASRRDPIVRLLAAMQEPDGSFRSGRGPVYATAMVLLAWQALFE